MAITAKKDNSVIQISYIKGQDENGKNILRLKSYRGVKPTAQDQDVLDCANILATLQQNTVNFVKRMDSAFISQE